MFVQQSLQPKLSRRCCVKFYIFDVLG